MAIVNLHLSVCRTNLKENKLLTTKGHHEQKIQFFSISTKEVILS